MVLHQVAALLFDLKCPFAGVSWKRLHPSQDTFISDSNAQPDP
jgi:hypothetical protein